MSQPSLAVRTDDVANTASVNLLPCRLHRDGEIDAVRPYWKPETVDGRLAGRHPSWFLDSNTVAGEKKVAYFRGRKLYAKTVELPEEHRGFVLAKTAPSTATGTEKEADSTGEQTEPPAMRAVAQFNEVTVWGHEAVADTAMDPYVRGLEEWLAVSDQVGLLLGFNRDKTVLTVGTDTLL